MTRLLDINQPASAATGAAQVNRSRYGTIPSRARIVVPIRSNREANVGLLEKSRDFVARHVLFLSRLSLATVFFWFGILKVANLSPVVGLLRASIPFLAERPYLELLGAAEIVIGVGLLVNRLANQATVLMIVHLLGTMSLFVIAPGLIFAPVFPVLTMDGEFVLKNVVLITSALVIMLLRPRPDLPRAE
jgi:putative oxidoreductase